MERRPRARDEETVRVALLVARETEEQEEVPLIRVLVRSSRPLDAAALPAAGAPDVPAKRP